MKIVSKNYDNRISSWNILLELTYQEYFPIASEIKTANIFQRKRVKSSSTVYSLLKDDLKQGCIIPPIILALNSSLENIEKKSNDEINKFIESKKESLQILDGLQRSFTILDVIAELKGDNLEEFLKSKLRVEIYIGISRTGILYRMLTLNTGQTPMSLRHQIEILYGDYLKQKINQISFLPESTESTVQEDGEYIFKEAIEGFNSYINRDELALDKQDILQNIESLDNLSKEDQEIELFEEFIKSFHAFYLKFIKISDDWVFEEADFDKKLNKSPFGKEPKKLIKRSQVITGFGAAIGKLFDQKSLTTFNQLNEIIEKISFENDSRESLNEIVRKLDEISNWSKKIGNDQRMFFMFFFKELLDMRSDAFVNIDKAIEEAFKMYERKTK